MKCPICTSEAKIKYHNVPDLQGFTQSTDSYYQCTSKQCLHLFADQNIAKDELIDFYSKYTTHQVVKPSAMAKIINLYQFLCDLIFSLWTILKQKSELKTMHLSGHNPGKLLDIGCGAGVLLRTLEANGWNQLYGFDFDKNALDCAVKISNAKLFNRFEDINEKFDYITFNHVVEHLNIHDLKSTLQIIRDKLSHKNTLIIVRTPNSQSLLARLTNSLWRGLESPRHRNIFTQKSLQLLTNAESFRIRKINTSFAMTFSVFIESNSFVGTQRLGIKILGLILYPIFCILSLINSILKLGWGEECTVEFFQRNKN